jgi:predicted nuclease of restriction endonuclease-like (RecB) superfamily
MRMILGAGDDARRAVSGKAHRLGLVESGILERREPEQAVSQGGVQAFPGDMDLVAEHQLQSLWQRARNRRCFALSRRRRCPGLGVVLFLWRQALVRDLGQMIESARRQVAVAANAALTTLYWQLGHRVLTDVLPGRRAEYGAQIVAAVVRQLEARHGHGFGEKNPRGMVQFAEVFPGAEIVAALLRQLGWTHFTLLIPIRDPLKRDFYAEMCRIEGWSTRELRRKIDGMLYERTALSKKSEELIRKELAALREKDELTPTLVFRDPYMLDFLELADTYSEKDLESAILREIEHFLLELGAGSAFVERQKRIILDGDDYCMSTCSSSTGACDA